MQNPSNNNNTYVDRQLEATMPWIGMYVALASLVCSLAMVADVVHGVRSKKFWFPCKYFSLNATFLTLLSIAMKLPVDLTTNMWAVTDRLAKISSLSLMATAIANFLPSIGSMSDKDILMNVPALGILIVTVIVDVCIQVVQTRSFLHHRVLFPEEMLIMSLMFILFFVLGSSSIMVSTTKRDLEAKYQEKHNVALNQELTDMTEPNTDKLRDLVKKYWVMAETSNPQFVVARSVTCAASGVICLLNALILGEARIRTLVVHKRFSLRASSYGFSTDYILIAQIFGVLAGTIAPAFRWCTAMSIRYSSRGDKRLSEELAIEDYWTQKLTQAKGSSVDPTMCRYSSRKFVHNLKVSTLSCLVVLQISIVFCCKLVLVISSSTIGPLFFLFKTLERYLNVHQRVRSLPRSDNDITRRHVRQHSLCLPGEAELPEKTLNSIWKEVDKVIERGKRKKFEKLLQLLELKTHNLEGVANFVRNEGQSLHSLPVVTLTSIAIALPNIERNKVSELIKGVSQGLYCVKCIENCLYKTGDLKSIAKAADTWAAVELSGKWLEMDLRKMSEEGRNSRETLQKLVDEGKRIVNGFRAPDWPMTSTVIAANSMYRISERILLSWNEEQDLCDQDLFDKLSVTIADILAGCLSKLTRVITMKCHRNAIEERKTSVHEAAFLLGQTGDVLDFLLQEGLTAENVQQPDEAPLDSTSGEDHAVIGVMEDDTTPEVFVPCHQSPSTVQMIEVLSF